MRTKKHIKMFVHYFLINMLLLNSESFQRIHSETNARNHSFENCLLYLTNITQNFIIYTENNNKVSEDSVLYTLVKALHTNHIPNILTHDLVAATKSFENNKSLVIIILTENTTNITKLMERVILKQFKYLILMSNDEDLNNVGRKFSRNDVTFIIKNSQDNYEFITYIPDIDEQSCNLNSNVKTINSCNEGVLEGATVFPIKSYVNRKQCPLKVGLAPNYPFAAVNSTKKDMSPVATVKGSDVELVNIISKYFNSSLEWYRIVQKQDSPFVNTEFTVYLRNGSLDFCVGGLYRIYGDIVEYSGIYNRQVVVWMYNVKREGRTWKALVKRLNGLHIFLTFYITYSACWLLVTKFDDNKARLSDTLVYNWGALLGGSLLKKGRTRKQKILNVVFLCMSIHWTAYISIQFFSFLTILGPPHMLRTNDDVMESGRQPYMIQNSKNFIEDQKYLAFVSSSKDCYSFEDCEKKIMDSNGVTIIVDGYFVPFQTQTAVNDEARFMTATENVLTIYHEMVLRKDSPIVMNFKKVILRLFEAGICDRLVKEAIGLTVVDKAKTATKNIMGNSYSCHEGCAITLLQSAGAFYIWAIGCTISFVVFLVELFLKWSRK